MNTFITVACLLAVTGFSHGSAIGGWGGDGLGWGGYGLGGYGLGGYGLGGYGSVISAPILAPAAISTQNLVKAAPIPVVRTVSAPIVSVPIVKSVPIIKSVPVVSTVGLGLGGLGGYGGYGGLGYGGLGYGGLGGYGLKGYGHH